MKTKSIPKNCGSNFLYIFSIEKFKHYFELINHQISNFYEVLFSVRLKQAGVVFMIYRYVFCSDNKM